jgi:aspartate-semialdehyde dehydrogenase
MTDRRFNVAVVGATGAVGQTILEILHSRKFPVDKIIPLASSKSAGERVKYGSETYVTQDLATFDFTGVHIALFSAGGSVSAAHAPRAVAAGAVVVDNTSHYRYEADIPLVVAEVNPEAIAGYTTRGIIANPNCSTMQMLVALAPLHRAARILRINVATYQSVSGAGRSGLDELGKQTADLLGFRKVKPKKFPVQIAFNLIPQIDVFTDNGYTKEEMKMVWETQKILDPAIVVNPTCVRVPVFYGHCEAINIETERKLSAAEAKELLAKAPGVVLVDDPQTGLFPTPVTHGAGKDPVFVGRVREDLSHSCGLNLWVVADNIRKGAALNAVQIAELLVKSYL